MRSPSVLLALLLTAFSTVAFAQNGPAVSFDLAKADRGGSMRARVADSDTTSKKLVIPAELEREIFKRLNATRRSNGLEDLEWDEQVAAVARLHSQNMAEKKFFSHRGTDGSMVDDRADRVGLGKWLMIGENIAYMRGFDDPAGLAIEKWMESTAHRNNLLGKNWHESAVGVSMTEDGTYYITQVFLNRK
ncbi:MAG TPA: CAP domain-containing protein [Pyrinomonadaceae bacterium]|nr:CAP domain-containing protein [Pyrinomonadaceae bacterium]